MRNEGNKIVGVDMFMNTKGNKGRGRPEKRSLDVIIDD